MTGYPITRGPVCFDCRQVADATLCDQFRVCDTNQVRFCVLTQNL
jgi:hypothetical protein